MSASTRRRDTSSSIEIGWAALAWPSKGHLSCSPISRKFFHVLSGKQQIELSFELAEHARPRDGARIHVELRYSALNLAMAGGQYSTYTQWANRDQTLMDPILHVHVK